MCKQNSERSCKLSGGKTKYDVENNDMMNHSLGKSISSNTYKITVSTFSKYKLLYEIAFLECTVYC